MNSEPGADGEVKDSDGTYGEKSTDKRQEKPDEPEPASTRRLARYDAGQPQQQQHQSTRPHPCHGQPKGRACIENKSKGDTDDEEHRPQQQGQAARAIQCDRGHRNSFLGCDDPLAASQFQAHTT